MATQLTTTPSVSGENSPLTRYWRTAGFFAVVVGAYWIYNLLAVPFIEPTVPKRRQQQFVPETAPELPIFDGLFEPGAWELNRPKMLRSKRGILLFQDYTPLPDGQLELKPCTLVFFAPTKRGAAPDEGRPIVLRAPQRAVLEFEHPMELPRMQMGQFQRGLLEGEITIYSPETRPGADDAIWMVTQFVQIEPRRIWAPQQVRFQFGRNQGSGRDLVIALDGAPLTEKVEPLALGSVRSIGLLQVDRVSLDFAAKSTSLLSSGSGSDQRRSATDANRDANVDSPDVERVRADITCQGAFTLMLEDLSASFDDRVFVTTVGSEGPPDQLFCDRLTVRLHDSRKSDDTNEDEVATKRLGIEQLEATGRPARLLAPSQLATVEAEWMAVNLTEQSVHIRDSARGILNWREHRFEGSDLHYHWPEDDPKKLGRLIAEGPGQYQGPLSRRDDSEPAQHLVARWTRGVQLQPQDHLHVLSLVGDAELRASELGFFQAGQLHVWLEQILVPVTTSQPIETNGPNTADSVNLGAAGGAAPDEPTERTEIRPKKLLATGNVRFDSSRLSGAAQRLETWIEYLEEPVVIAGPPAVNSSPAAAGPDTILAVGGDKEDEIRKLDVRGEIVQIELQRRSEETRLVRATVDGNVTLAEAIVLEQQAPLVIRGDRLHLEADGDGFMDADVRGRPAQVHGRGMFVESESVQVSQAGNQIWIDGAGHMQLPPPRTTSKSTPDPVQVQWTRGLKFDGQQVEINGDVVLVGGTRFPNGEHQKMTVRSEQLLVGLNANIDLQRLEKPQDVAANSLRFPGAVKLDTLGVDTTGQKISQDRMEVQDLWIEPPSGRIQSQGPGQVRSTRYNTSARTAGLLNSPPAGGATGKRELVFLNVRFANGIQGNYLQRELTFQDQIRAVYGPIPDWDSSLDADRPETWGTTGVLLTCDKLILAMMGPADDHSVELKAVGNTTVEGRMFTATAERISYNQSKDLLTLSGDGRNDAHIQSRLNAGADPNKFSAGIIRYSPSTGRLDVSDGRTLEIFQPPR